jgi:heme-degrading monooxygenase HmoA
MIVSVLPIAVEPGAEEEFVRTFAELRVFEHSHASGGFLGGRVLRPLAAGEPFLVIAEWENEDAYQGWLDNPVRVELSAALDPLLADHVAHGGFYAEVHRG